MSTATKDTAPPLSQRQQVGPATPLTVAEEALKRNTDCVYFLASPLTCKKGSECEYRHSDYARMNPRDCWYWLNGNCLNAKCSFRHPPLEGLVPPQGGNFAGPAPRVLSHPPVPSTPQDAAKQAVPCIFFQQGYCLKGDVCPFLHRPVPPPTNKMQRASATTVTAEAPTVFKKTFGGPETCTQTKMTFQATVPKVGKVPCQAPADAGLKVELAQPFDKLASGKRYQRPNGVVEEATKYKEAIAPVENGNLRSRTTRAHHASSVVELNYQNGRDADESLRESSPGFDVLVDDKLGDIEYYPNEDMRMGGYDSRNLNEFDMGRGDDYNSVADIDSEIIPNRRGYGSYDRSQEEYNWKPHGASSERTLGERAHYDRRGSYKLQSPDVAQNSDLRLRLSMHRQGTGLRSAVNPDYHSEDQGHRSSHRDTRRSLVRENSLGNRLQHRLKLPGKSPPLSGSSYSERESEKERNRVRLSPSRPPAFSQGRLRDRLGGRIQDESSECRYYRGAIRNDYVQANGVNFAGPKSLVELIGTKQTDNRQQFPRGEQPVSGGKLRDTVLPSSSGTESNNSFDGPKPLSEILKRKRESGMTASTAGVNSDNKDLSKLKEDMNLISSGLNCAADTREQVSASAQSQTDVEENNQPLGANRKEEEVEDSNKKIKLIKDETSIVNNEIDPGIEEGATVAFGDEEEHEVGDGGERDVVDGDEHEVDEENDHENGEYEYEQDDNKGYNPNEGETAQHDYYMDEDDGDDDFAKKLGVSF